MGSVRGRGVVWKKKTRVGLGLVSNGRKLKCSVCGQSASIVGLSLVKV